jgi:hypothetical protein
MEARVRLIAAGILFGALFTTQSQIPQGLERRIEDLERRFPKTSRNAAAEELESLAPSLGIELKSRNLTGDSPEEEKLDDYQQVGFAAWLDSQLKSSDEAIGPPAPKVKEFLDRRRVVVSRTAGLLLHEVPEWGFDLRQRPGGDRLSSDVHLLTSVNRLLLSEALLEERLGHHAEAGEYLEASWSLSQSLAGRPDLLSLIIAVALWKQQAGALRKMAEPPFQWAERLSNDSARNRLLSAIEDEPLIGFLNSSDTGSSDPSWPNVVERMSAGYEVLASLIRESSACALTKRPLDEIRRRVLQEFKTDGDMETTSGDEDENADESRPRERTPADLERTARILTDIGLTTAIDMAFRGARLQIDRELTLKILELRQQKAASRPRRWPEAPDLSSAVCSESSYEYSATRAVMTLRFAGTVGEESARGLILPLTFEARAPQPTPTPTPARRATPRPRS